MPPAFPAALVDVHKRNNRATAAAWEAFAGHRAHLTRHLSRGRGSLLVLGAGNGNDLDLAALAGAYAAIHLADVDEAALARAHQRQPAEVQAKVVRHAPVDLGGALRRLGTWARQRPMAAQLEALPTTAAAQVVEALPGGHDVVVSSCLLTQLLHSARLALGVSHPDLAAVAGGLVGAHLAALLQLCAPTGTAFLVTDVVSSESYPLEEMWSAREPLALLEELSAAGNCFTGADPAYVLRLVNGHPAIAPMVARAEVLAPWLWRMSDEVMMLVYAIELQKRDARPGADRDGRK